MGQLAGEPDLSAEPVGPEDRGEFRTEHFERHQPLLPEIAGLYDELRFEAERVVKARVTSAVATLRTVTWAPTTGAPSARTAPSRVMLFCARAAVAKVEARTADSNCNFIVSPECKKEQKCSRQVDRIPIHRLFCQ